MNTWVFPASRRKAVEWTMRSRSRSKHVLQGSGSSVRGRRPDPSARVAPGARISASIASRDTRSTMGRLPIAMAAPACACRNPGRSERYPPIVAAHRRARVVCAGGAAPAKASVAVDRCGLRPADAMAESLPRRCIVECGARTRGRSRSRRRRPAEAPHDRGASVDVRIGIVQTAKELEVELAEDVDRDKLLREIEAALADDAVLWLTDRRGRRVGVPVAKVAYVEVGAPSPDRRVGFGAP